MTYDEIYGDMEAELQPKFPAFSLENANIYDFAQHDPDEEETLLYDSETGTYYNPEEAQESEPEKKPEIEKGKFRPIICYAETPEDSCLVSNFIVVCTDKATEKEFIIVEYDQQFGKNGIYRYLDNAMLKKDGVVNESKN